MSSTRACEGSWRRCRAVSDAPAGGAAVPGETGVRVLTVGFRGRASMPTSTPEFTGLDMPAAFIARQPIFDRNLRVVSYELLFRGHGYTAGARIDNPEQATARPHPDLMFTLRAGRTGGHGIPAGHTRQ